jgi:peptidoglycan/xylan/chitin deacetylase (PgdA/CDA1 family)
MRGILTYHSIDGSGSPISVSEASFRRHVAWLASGAVSVLPLAELAARQGGKPALALTFDDGFESLADFAWPLLRAHGLPATVFVPTSRVGLDNAWGEQETRGIPTLRLCGWDALAAMAEQGLEIGSHTVTHARLVGMGAGLVRDELALSAEAIEQRIGRRPRAFCYPYGAFDAQCARIAGERYELGVTTEHRLLAPRDAPLLLPRLDAYYYRGNRRLEDFGTPAFGRHVWVRSRLRRLRAALGAAY